MVNHPYACRGGLRRPKSGAPIYENTWPDGKATVALDRHETPVPDWKAREERTVATKTFVVTHKRRRSVLELAGDASSY
jgi:hypothetical protein